MRAVLGLPAAGDVFSAEVIEQALARCRSGLGGLLWARYREVEPGIYELLDETGAVVAWANEEGIHQIEEARRPANALPRLFGVGVRVFLLPDRLEVLRP